MPKFTFALAAALVLCVGCSHDTSSQVQTISAGDVTATINPDPDPFTTGSIHGVPDAGTNDLFIKLVDANGAPIVDASVTVTAVTQLTGGTGDSETAKSNGDGSYHVDKLSTPLTEVYSVKMLVDRPGKPVQELDFKLTPQ